MTPQNKDSASQSRELNAIKLSVAVYVVVFALKIGIYLVSGVMALMAEALHTLSDIFISGFLLVATIYSRKEADEVHMFGYGRAQNVAALVAATLFISFTSLRLYEEAIPRLFNPGETAYQNLPLVLGVLIFSMLIAAFPLVSLFRQGGAGATARAQLRELVNDELGLFAALVGTLFILSGEPVADPIASIIVATIIAYNAIGLFRENVSFLLGRSPGADFLAKVKSTALSVDGVLGIHDLRAEYIGPDTIHTGMHITVHRGMPVEEAEHIAHEVHRQVHQATGCRYCVVHVDAAKPEETH